jgi:hypothetical protein
LAALLALGVSVTSAVLGLVEALLFRYPPGIEQPDQILTLPIISNYPTYLDVFAHATTFELAVYSQAPHSVRVGAERLNVQVECISDGYLGLLGVTSHAAPRPGEAFISERLRRLFKATGVPSPNSLILQEHAFQVVATPPHEFRGLEPGGADIWLALTSIPSLCNTVGDDALYSTHGHWLTAVARPRTGFSRVDVEHELRNLLPIADLQAMKTITLREYQQDRAGRLAPISLLLFASSILVLAATVVATMTIRVLLATGRADEVRIRRELGARSRDLLAPFVVEQLIFAGACGSMALLLSFWFGSLLSTYFFYDRMGSGVRSWLAMPLAITLLSSSACEIVPAIHWLRLHQLPRASSFARRLKSLALATQVASAMVLLLGAGFFMTSVHRLMTNLGFGLEGVVVVTGGGDANDSGQLDALALRLRGVPFVEELAVSSGSLLEPSASRTYVPISTSSAAHDGPQETYPINAVSENYFRLLRMRFREGGAFLPQHHQPPNSVILDADLAERLWPGESAVGKCAFIGSDCFKVWGVTEPRRSIMIASRSSELFVPLSERRWHIAPEQITVRMTSSSEPALGLLKQVVTAGANRHAAWRVNSLTTLADLQLGASRGSTAVFGVFALLIASIATLGTSASAALWIRENRLSLAIRSALGCQPAHLARQVLRQSILPASAGLLIGALVMCSIARRFSPLLFDVSTFDPFIWVGAIGSICVVLAIATAWPAYKATRVDPADALRLGGTPGQVT